MSKAAPDLVQRARSLCQQQGRADLVARLGHTTRRLSDPSVRVLVVGEFKQGKSQLINALVNAPVCPVDDDVATAVPMEVRYGAQPAGAILLASRSAAVDGGLAEPDEVDVAIDTVAGSIGGRVERADGRTVVGAKALLPRAILQEGLVFVDTPGVGGLASSHSASTLAALPTADAVILVSDASSEFTAPEVTFLRQALAACPTVALVLSKTDLFPDWRRVRDLDRGHLERLALTLPIIPVSSSLRLAAASRSEASLNEESGFPDLIRYLRTEVLGRRDQLLNRSTAHDINGVVDNLKLAITAERDALADPSGVPELVVALNEARSRADELKRRSSRWQSTLSDGVADLNADLDHDLRDRIRVIVREAETSIDQGDPGESWEEFSTWYEQRISAAIADTFLWAERNAGWLVEEVGQHFSEDSKTLTPDFHLDDTTGVVDPVNELGQLDTGRLNAMQKMLVGLRGSYGGILMFGLLTGLAGIPLVNPISVGAGIVLGTKAYRDDADQRLKRRQAEAKVLVRKYSDDVIFYVSKQLKDRLRIVQRAVRDHYNDVAEELSTSLQDSVNNAQKAAQASTAERAARLVEVRKSLAQLDEISTAARQLSAGSPAPSRSQRPAAVGSAANGEPSRGGMRSAETTVGTGAVAGPPAVPMRPSA
jgi:hypothetical protein